MNTIEHPEMTPLLEGPEEAIRDYSRRLDALDIKNTVELGEDCRPGG